MPPFVGRLLARSDADVLGAENVLDRSPDQRYHLGMPILPILVLVLLPFLLSASGDPLIDLVMALREGDARLIAAAALSLLMAAAATARDKIAWLRGDRGGAVLVMVLSFLGGLVTSLGSGAPVDFKMFLTALEIGLAAVGGYTWVRRLIWPKDSGGQRAATLEVQPLTPPASRPS